MSQDIKHVTNSISWIQVLFHYDRVTLYRLAQLPSRPSDLCTESGQAVLLICNLQESSAGGKIQLQEGPVFHPAAVSFLPAQAEESFILNHEADFQAQRAPREMQIYQIPVWQLLSWAVLKRNYSLKTLPKPLSRHFAHASPSPSHQGDLHLVWLCKKHQRDQETTVAGPKGVWGWTASK